jgi:branched-chain amino acid transport system substrate-binding protein
MQWVGRSKLRVFALVAGIALVAAACADNGDPVAERPDDELLLGYVLPESGPLSFLGPPMISGVQMAVAEMEDAGGPAGLPIRLLTGDEAGEASQASEAAARLLDEGVHAIIGAAASGMSRAIIDQVTGAGTVQCSPSNTSAEFSDYDDNGYYFRTAPPDVLQGQILAEVVLGDDNERVALLGRGDGYGRGLVESTEENLRDGGAEIVLSEIYDPDATTFDAEVSAVRDADPDAVVLVTFDEGIQLIQGLLEADFAPDQLYGVDGNASSELNESVDPGNPNVLDGMKGTQPSAGDPAGGFLERLSDFDPGLTETIFAPQAYDCTILIGLSVVAAEGPDPAAMRDSIVGFTRGDNECSGFAECAALLEAGETIAYQFASGTRSFLDAGEPENGIYDVWAWEDGEFVGSIHQEEIFLE